MRSRAQRAITSWIASLAVLVVVLAPMATQAVGLGSGASWVEVCTSQGSKWMAVDEAPMSDDSSPAVGHAFEHCALCLVHAHAGIPPSSLAADLHVPELAHEFPVAFLAAPRTPHAWVTAQPRAPPFVS